MLVLEKHACSFGWEEVIDQPEGIDEFRNYQLYNK